MTKENSILEIHVRLLGEGTNCSRPTQGVIVGPRLFRLLPTTDYNPDDEHWEFLPGSIVRAKEVRNDDGVYLLAVEGPFKFWKVLDKRRLLLALMEELAGDARISFEGDLHGLALLHMPDSSDEPTPTLRRNTRWPKQDFVIVPLKPSMGRKIIAAIGGTIPNAIIHIQIEKNGLLQFGAYDNFHPECIYFGSAVKQAVIESLISQGIIRPYTERRPKREPKHGSTNWAVSSQVVATKWRANEKRNRVRRVGGGTPWADLACATARNRACNSIVEI